MIITTKERKIFYYSFSDNELKNYVCVFSSLWREKKNEIKCIIQNDVIVFKTHEDENSNTYKLHYHKRFMVKDLNVSLLQQQQ